jgi:hypothetical protein
MAPPQIIESSNLESAVECSGNQERFAALQIPQTTGENLCCLNDELAVLIALKLPNLIVFRDLQLSA